MGQEHLLPLPRWTIIVHSVQILVAVLILGLDAYGIKYIPYNALIFSLVTAILTLIICAYIITSTLALHSLYNYWAVLALHILMVIFWVTDLGLVANLASLWSGGRRYSYYYNSYSYKRDTTTVGTYYGCLAAGAFFGAVQFVLWVLSLVFVAMYIHRHRGSQGANPEAPASTGVQQAVPVEEPKPYNAVQPPQQPYGQPVPTPQQYPTQPQGQYAQQPVYGQQPQQPTYAQYAPDPVQREQTVSPVSSAAGYSSAPPPNPNVSELSTQQPHSYGQPVPHNPDIAELDQRR